MYQRNAEAFTGAISLQALDINHITIANSQVFVVGNVNRKTLPREADWMWHQSKSKITTPIRGGQIIMTKLNPRKVKGSSLPCPSYKLWVCQIIDGRSRGELNFLWCEKGKINSSAFPPLVKTTPRRSQTETMSLSDLSFLSEFVPHEIACEFGWISAPSRQIGRAHV